jgi:hypothetical protein
MSLCISKFNISPTLFQKIEEIHTLAKKIETEKKTLVLYHLTSLFEAYHYVFYVNFIDTILQKRKGKIVDWGGFVGQVTILLRSLGYDCDNAVLAYPSTKKDFERFEIPYVLIKNQKKFLIKKIVCLLLSLLAFLNMFMKTT